MQIRHVLRVDSLGILLVIARTLCQSRKVRVQWEYVTGVLQFAVYFCIHSHSHDLKICTMIQMWIRATYIVPVQKESRYYEPPAVRVVLCVLWQRAFIWLVSE